MPRPIRPSIHWSYHLPRLSTVPVILLIPTHSSQFLVITKFHPNKSLWTAARFASVLFPLHVPSELLQQPGETLTHLGVLVKPPPKSNEVLLYHLVPFLLSPIPAVIWHLFILVIIHVIIEQHPPPPNREILKGSSHVTFSSTQSLAQSTQQVVIPIIDTCRPTCLYIYWSLLHDNGKKTKKEKNEKKKTCLCSVDRRKNSEIPNSDWTLERATKRSQVDSR
jgi:hypothetical protein